MKRPEGIVGVVRGFHVGFSDGLVVVESVVGDGRLIFTRGQAEMLGRFLGECEVGTMLGQAIEGCGKIGGWRRDAGMEANDG